MTALVVIVAAGVLVHLSLGVMMLCLLSRLIGEVDFTNKVIVGVVRDFNARSETATTSNCSDPLPPKGGR